MTLSHRVVVAGFKGLTRLLCRIDGAQLARVPDQGPLIIVTNHINLLEIPIVYTHLQPRPVTGFVAAYRWKNPWLRWLLTVCGAIRLRRGEADIAAMRKALEMLKAGHIIVIAPEGTRSGHGRLQKAHPGAVLLALRSGAPLLPLVFYGGERYGAHPVAIPSQVSLPLAGYGEEHVADPQRLGHATREGQRDITLTPRDKSAFDL